MKKMRFDFMQRVHIDNHIKEMHLNNIKYSKNSIYYSKRVIQLNHIINAISEKCGQMIQ